MPISLRLLLSFPNSSDLDKFMEAYCIALNKLKEAMEKPVKETTSFIKDMYAELKRLCVPSNADEPLLCPKQCRRTSCS
ncbi:hypothetical protein FEM48_Zijuj10G0115900 [Ziziphus jujuba var. spinosa]|uniref:KNOX2 domain-containing protein n=1 Tax=Ziziphus jujuba var. spinosa TaxID=714518 RepID=A0A978UN54_ZIZJJ|nr:hypothetical protein FEM48_Zijuj10G0115900 [Ziziphus jujuba var. spinosa]